MTKSAHYHDVCVLCGSDKLITFHHLIPKSCHRNKWFRKNFEKTDMQERGIYLCRQCHSFIHKQYSEKVLGREFNTLAMLLANDKVQNFIAWKKKQH